MIAFYNDSEELDDLAIDYRMNMDLERLLNMSIRSRESILIFSKMKIEIWVL